MSDLREELTTQRVHQKKGKSKVGRNRTRAEQLQENSNGGQEEANHTLLLAQAAASVRVGREEKHGMKRNKEGKKQKKTF